MRGEYNEKTGKINWVLEYTDEKFTYMLGLLVILGIWIAGGFIIASFIFSSL